VAVPSDRRPPAPRVETQVDPTTGIASITVRAVGVDLVALQAAEPGLFDEPPAFDAAPPEYRLRRASGGVPDALYARVIGRGALQLLGDEFVATVTDAPTDSGLSAYVRYYYWAEVRLPPERRLPQGIAEEPLPAGAIEPMQAAQQQDAPGVFSEISAPAMIVFIPADIPRLAADSVSATIGAGVAPGTWKLTLKITDSPVVSTRAVGAFKLRIYLKINDGEWVPEPGETQLIGNSLEIAIERASAIVPTLSISLVVMDPIGREADPLMLDAMAI
jgi:hypothetical protein